MAQSRSAAPRANVPKSVVRTGALLGIGLVGAADEVAFHQLLQWHNFYIHTDEYWRIFSDGLFHAFTAALLFVGAMRLWAQRRQASVIAGGKPLWSGILMGMGGFQLFDGIVSHKILRLHPVREGVDNIWVYDLAWNIPAALVLLAGWLLWRTLRDEVVAGAVSADYASTDQGHR